MTWAQSGQGGRILSGGHGLRLRHFGRNAEERQGCRIAHFLKISLRIDLAQGDALNFDPAKSFGIARLTGCSVLYAVDDPGLEGRSAAGHGHAFPCGELHVADFGQCENLPVFLKTALVAWLRQFGVTPRSALPQTMETLAAAQGRTVRFLPHATAATAGASSRSHSRAGGGRTPSIPRLGCHR